MILYRKSFASLVMHAMPCLQVLHDNGLSVREPGPQTLLVETLDISHDRPSYLEKSSTVKLLESDVVEQKHNDAGLKQVL